VHKFVCVTEPVLPVCSRNEQPPKLSLAPGSRCACTARALIALERLQRRCGGRAAWRARGPATGSTAVPKARGARCARRRRQTPQRRHTVPAMGCRGCAPCACGRCSRQRWHCCASAGSRRIRQAEYAPDKWSMSVQHAVCGCVLRQHRHALVGCRCVLAGTFGLCWCLASLPNVALHRSGTWPSLVQIH